MLEARGAQGKGKESLEFGTDLSKPETVSDSASPSPKPASAAASAEAASSEAAVPAKPAAAAKAPAPEDRPFAEFINELLLPALDKEIQAYGGPSTALALVEGPMPVIGVPCWMVTGSLPEQRRFWLCFTEPNLQSAKTVVVAERGSEPSVLESFLIDEKRTTLALLVSRLVQRLNGQKWLGPN